jgi:hypothetical protein
MINQVLLKMADQMRFTIALRTMQVSYNIKILTFSPTLSQMFTYQNFTHF